MKVDLTTIILSGIAALIGSAISIIATYVTYKWDIKKQQTNEVRMIFGLLQALHDELETLMDIYQKRIGSRLDILEKGNPILLYWPVINDYFTVYNSNVFLIGRIKDNDLRKEIVSTYTLAKSLVDSFRLNNEFSWEVRASGHNI